jgi:hypothetical protein
MIHPLLKELLESAGKHSDCRRGHGRHVFAAFYAKRLNEWANFSKELRRRNAPLDPDDPPLHDLAATLLRIGLVGLVLADALERLVEMISLDIESCGHVIEIVPFSVTELLDERMPDLGPAGATDGEGNS